MKPKLINNLLWKILSVLTAIVLWLIVVNIDDAVTSKPFRNIKVNMLNMEALTSQGQMCRVEEGTDVVDITVYARRSVLSKLTPSDFVATADMQKNLRYDSMVKIDVAYVGNLSSSSIQKIETSRTNVLVNIEESVTEQFKVSVETDGEPSSGLVKGSAVPEQTLVEITGPISVVNRINKVLAKVNTTGITGTQVRTCRLQLLDSDGDEIDGTYLEYIGKDTDFEVTVTTLNKKLVGISFDISEAAPEGHGLVAVSYKPETVTIAGIKSQISPIYNLNIPPEALNPNRESGQIEQTVDISQYLPEGIIIPYEDEKEIVVTMDIQPFVTNTYSFHPGKIQYMNIQEGLAIDGESMAPLEVPISALAQNLAVLVMDNITLSVDLSDYRRAGNYTVPVTVEVPKGYFVPEDLMMEVKLIEEKEEAEE